MEKPRIVVVTGPTAAGKSALALALAEFLGGEIVSADSVQVYRGLDIGTAKPTREERARVPHHLIDVAEPTEAYSAGRFREEAGAAIREIVARGRVPLVCGGTGLYLRALLHGLAPGPGRDDGVRGELEAAWDRGGRAALLRELWHGDPEAAARLHPNDRTRIIRALEVWRLTGRPLSALQRRHGFAESPYAALWLGVAVARDELYRRIDRRTLQMLEAGWVDEVRGLLRQGYPPECPAFQSIGYRQLVAFLRNGGDAAAVALEIQRETRHLAKRQLTWFRRVDLEWVAAEDLAAVASRARNHLQTRVAPIR
jgi:tRNA dimethylallyltransferase